MPDAKHVGVYGEVNANLIDGSSIWLQSICLTLAKIPATRVTLLLRAPIERDLVLDPLRGHPRIQLVEPARWRSTGLLRADEAIHALAELDRADPFDVVLLRGAGTAAAVAEQGPFDGRIWLYHVPTEAGEETLARLMPRLHRVICQTPAIRNRVEEAMPSSQDRTIPLPPMIPGIDPEPRAQHGPIRRMVYAGKIAPEYFGLEMIDLLRRLRADIPGLELHVAGDKVHNPRDQPDFAARARSALEGTPGVVWHGGMSREAVLELVRGSELALSLRHPDLDSSAEMSTKVLEFASVGCPVVLNANQAHVSLLGADYPLLASDLDQAARLIARASAVPGLREEAGRRLWELARRHTFDAAATAIAPHLEAAGSAVRVGAGADDRPRLLLSGHNFAFAEGLVERARLAGAQLRWDRWQGHGGGDEEGAATAAEWADVVFCEWCLGNAVWHSHRKQDDRALVVRFHRMELETRYPGELDLESVDTMVFVAPHVLEAACARFGWAPDDLRLRVVPNAIDVARFARPKLPGSEFTLGMIGFVPWLKRLDRALDILEVLRARDDRYRLVVKGRSPWEYGWMSAREEERRRYRRTFERARRSPLLRGAVVFDSFGSDVADFLRQVGWILSTSEIEGHSVALAEGMASGAIPVVVRRPGAAQQYESRWVHEDSHDAADAVLALAAGEGVAAAAAEARAYAARWGWDRIGPIWDELLRLPSAASVAAGVGGGG